LFKIRIVLRRIRKSSEGRGGPQKDEEILSSAKEIPRSDKGTLLAKLAEVLLPDPLRSGGACRLSGSS